MKKFLVGLLAFLGTVCSVAMFVSTGYYIGKVTTANTCETALTATVIDSTGATAPVEVEEETKTVVDEMSVFQKFTSEYWEEGLSFTEIENILGELAVVIAYDLHLETIPSVKVIYDKSVSYNGVHIDSSCLIKLNYYQIFRYDEPEIKSVETLSHELRHHYQYQRVEKGYKTPLELSYINYKTVEKDGYNAYYTQLCEQDARAYASFYKKYFQSQMTDYQKGE